MSFTQVYGCVQVVDSTIELTEKQHSSGSIPHSSEERSESGVLSHGDLRHEHHEHVRNLPSFLDRESSNVRQRCF